MSRRILLVGGGSGGHITPLLAVAAELKRQQPDMELVYVGQTGDGLGDIPAQDPNIDQIFTVRAGKFRRYHGEGLRQLLDFKTLFLNIRDVLYVVIGLWQSWRLLRRLEPEAIFIKGGFVGVPVGLAAAKQHIPYITHDSDAIPGLANRIIARWATTHAVALPEEVYHYPARKTVTTGIPVPATFVPVSAKLQRQYKEQIGVPEDARVVAIVGGGLGSKSINDAATEVLPHVMRDLRDLHIVHVAGRKLEDEVRAAYKKHLSPTEQERVQVFGFLTDLYTYTGAADVVVGRAGATSLADLAMQAKACIIVPSPFLAGGHQLKNAAYLEEQGAVALLDEEAMRADPNRLAKLITGLLNDPAGRLELRRRFSTFAKPHASRDLAELILQQVTERSSTGGHKRHAIQKK